MNLDEAHLASKMCHEDPPFPPGRPGSPGPPGAPGIPSSPCKKALISDFAVCVSGKYTCPVSYSWSWHAREPIDSNFSLWSR